MVTGMLQVFIIDVYALLDPDATLSFVTSLVSKKFNVLLDFLIEPFSIKNSMVTPLLLQKYLGVVLYH